jgi:flagellar biogenesis protein FliO
MARSDSASQLDKLRSGERLLTPQSHTTTPAQAQPEPGSELAYREVALLTLGLILTLSWIVLLGWLVIRLIPSLLS